MLRELGQVTFHTKQHIGVSGILPFLWLEFKAAQVVDFCQRPLRAA